MATTTTVDCTADPAALGAALASASDGDTLGITRTCRGTFEISHDLTLAGSGGAGLDGDGTDTVVLTIHAGKTVGLSGLTVSGGGSSSPFQNCDAFLGGVIGDGGRHQAGCLPQPHQSSKHGNDVPPT